MRFAGCADLLVPGVVWCLNNANSVLNNLQRVRTVQLTCAIGWAAGSWSLVRDTGPTASVQFVQFSSRALSAVV